jgi:signal transduction histidine kinase/DNA-binding NarL/FixJ family response regulator
MLFPGTQMHMVTFLFVCIEIVILFYLIIYRLARPDDRTATLNIILIFLLIIYNVSSGLLPDENLPGSYFIQMTIAYATGFITPCYFPYYVYHAFNLERLHFHAYKGVFLCLIIPYAVFVLLFGVTGNLEIAKDLLIIPVAYAVWVIYSLNKAISYKYENDFSSRESKEEIAVLFFSLAPWVGLPIIDYFNLGQVLEASITNVGFLLLFALQMKRQIETLRIEHEQLLASEKKLKTWNTTLQAEVNKQTSELKKVNEQQMNTFINLAHETKTPVTLVSGYMDAYIARNGSTNELEMVQRNLHKLSADIVNLFDLEKFKKGFDVYNHNQVADFREILVDSISLFEVYAAKRSISITVTANREAYVKSDPLAIHRIINNLVENAIKFSDDGSSINILLETDENLIVFTVQDYGIGIAADKLKKIFEPYYQIGTHKKNTQGMGLGLPIAKKVIEDLKGRISLISNSQTNTGTTVTVQLPRHQIGKGEAVSKVNLSAVVIADDVVKRNRQAEINPVLQTIMIVEDNTAMQNFLSDKLSGKYNIVLSANGNEALTVLKEHNQLPDLILSDIMMDKLDGYAFARIVANNELFNHIPFIFISAKSTIDDRLKGLKLGAIDFIAKPFKVNELLLKIETILQTVDRQKKAALKRTITFLNQGSLPTDKSDTYTNFEQNCILYGLTEREKDIARLIGQGYPYKLIADSLFISEKTVSKHVQNMFEKLTVSNKIELMNKLGTDRQLSS